MTRAFQVHVDSKALALFRRRAIAHHKKVKGEYMELLFVHRTIGEFHIKKFVKLTLSNSTWNGVEYSAEEWNRLKQEAELLGLCLGSIHTHPSSYGTQPSKEDYTAGAEGEVLMGICEIYDPEYVGCKTCNPVDPNKPRRNKFETKLDFWIPQPPCEIVIVK